MVQIVMERKCHTISSLSEGPAIYNYLTKGDEPASQGDAYEIHSVRFDAQIYDDGSVDMT